MAVRACEEKDIPAVVCLMTQLAEVATGGYEFETDRLRDLFVKMAARPDTYANFVYEDEGKVVGFLSEVFYMTFFHRVGTAQVNELVVDDNYRGKGIGHALMKAAEEEARRRNMDELEVGTESDNLKAQAFYRKYGFDGEYILFGLEFDR
ncbi:MAG: GNAT family N-acetyltransferase [Chloroflexi bacterium]|nr:GNAT family N-acetyltransferase [Chloroflexota bacterium]